MKQLIVIALLAGTLSAGAQELKKTGYTVEELVPEGWTHTEATGDLNKDGISDMVVLTTPNFKENMKTRDDGYVYNFNHPVLAVYFGSSDGTLTMWRQYDNVVPGEESEADMYDNSVSITDRGVMRIDLEYMMSMGGWGLSQSAYLYRYHNGDFYLIGHDANNLQRNTGEMEEVSINYLTCKRQSITRNEFDKKVKRREKWTNIAKKPLKRLGEEELDTDLPED